MLSTELASIPSRQTGPFPDQLRRAVSAYLARFKGSPREHTESDLRCYRAAGGPPGSWIPALGHLARGSRDAGPYRPGTARGPAPGSPLAAPGRAPAPAAGRPDIYVTVTARYLQPLQASSGHRLVPVDEDLVLTATIRDASTGAALTSVQLWPRQPEHPRGPAVSLPLPRLGSRRRLGKQ